MYETYPKGKGHKKDKHEMCESGWGGNPSKTRYTGSGMNGIDTNESKQHTRAPFNNGGGNKQVSATYAQKSGRNGVNFNTTASY